jgi:hypothetical protein
MLLAQISKKQLLATGKSLRIFKPKRSQHQWYSIAIETPAVKSKVWSSAEEAVRDIESGAVLLCGGELQGHVSGLARSLIRSTGRIRFGWYTRSVESIVITCKKS